MACKTSGTLYMIPFEIALSRSTNAYNITTTAWLVGVLGPDVRYRLDPDTNYTSLDRMTSADINGYFSKAYTLAQAYGVKIGYSTFSDQTGVGISSLAWTVATTYSDSSL